MTPDSDKTGQQDRVPGSAGQQPPAEVMEWLHETYKPEGVEIWLASWRKAAPERRAFLERLAHMDSMGT